MKNKLRSLNGAETPEAMLKNVKMTADDKEIMKQIIMGPKRPTGYRSFTNSRQFQLDLPYLVAKELQGKEKRDAVNPQQDKNLYFSTAERLKLKAWQNLKPEEREYWRDQGKNVRNRGIEEMTP